MPTQFDFSQIEARIKEATNALPIPCKAWLEVPPMSSVLGRKTTKGKQTVIKQILAQLSQACQKIRNAKSSSSQLKSKSFSDAGCFNVPQDAIIIELAKEATQAFVRIADALSPPARAIVTTKYVAEQLGVTVTRVGQLAKQNEIPTYCIVKGTGNGKLWKFHKKEIDKWINQR